MKKWIANILFIACIFLGTGIVFGVAIGAMVVLTPVGDNVGGSGTIRTLDQWTSTSSPGTAITQRTFGKDVRITGLESEDCIGTDANGVLQAGTCTGGAGGTGLASSSPWTVGQLAYVTSDAAVTSVATGTLTTTATGLEFDATRSLVGGASVLSLTSGYIIPLSASTTNWNSFFDTPSTRITAGDALTWSSNTLNFDGGASPAGDLGGTWASPSVDDDSHAHTGTTLSGIDIGDDTNLAATWPVILTGDTLTYGGISTSSPISAASGLLYATGVNTFASVSTSSPVQMDITGNAGTATALETARDINGVSFDGTANITINAASSTLLADTNTFSATNTIAALQVGSTAIGSNVLKISPRTGLTVSNSESVGGIFNMNLGTTDSIGFVGYTNATGANRLMSLVCDSTSYTGNCFHVRSDSTGASALNVLGSPEGLGIVKIGSNGVGDADASGLSIDTSLSSFVGQGIFLKGNASGKLLNFRGSDNTEHLTLLPGGQFGLGTSTPYAKLSLKGISGQTTPLFAVASSTNSLMFSIGSSGAVDISSGATTTANNGIDISDGCFAIDGTCLSTGGSGTVTQVDTTWPILGGPITTTGTLTFGGLATTSQPASSNLLYSNGTNGLTPVATSSLTINAPLTTSGTAGALVGGTAFTIDIDDIKAADLDLTDITINDFTNDANFITLSSLSASSPLVYNSGTGAFSFTGLATTSQPASSNILVSNGGAGVYGVATSTLTASSPLTGSFVQIGSGGSLGCQTASGSQAGCISSTDWTTFNNKITALGSGWATTTGTNITFSTSTASFNGLTFGNTIVPSASTLLFTPTVTGTLDNAGLTNSSVSYGGISLSLGGSDATPAFNLADATGLTKTGIANSGTLSFDWDDTEVADALTISGGSVNNSPIGASTASTAVFTNSTSTNATTTSLGVLNLTAADCDVKSTTGGVLFCGTDSTTAGADPFTWETTYGVLAAATSSPLWAQGQFFASSTAYFSDAIHLPAAAGTATSSILGDLRIGSAIGDNKVRITADRVFSASNSVGGLLNLTNTTNTGPALVAYTNQASSAGNLANFRCDNASMAHDCVKVDYDGTGDGLAIAATAAASNALSLSNTGVDHTLNVSYTGSTANKGAMNLTSTNTGGSVFQISGDVDGVGIGKITHSGNGDADSSILSLAATDATYAGQGIFLDMATSTLTQKVLNIRADSNEVLTTTGYGTTTLLALDVTTAIDIFNNFYTTFAAFANGIVGAVTNAVLTGTWDFSGATVKQHTYSSFSYATSTAWTATTTIPLGPAYTAESWSGVKCFTDAGTLNVSFYDGTNRMNLFNASTTVGTVGLSTNNTFTASEKRYVDIGTPASSPTKISCTVDKIVNN